MKKMVGKMSSYHQQDVDGCDYTMSIINHYENRIISWTHTEGDFDKTDMVWECESKYEGVPNYIVSVENKDRRWKWVSGLTETGEKVMVQDKAQPQYISSFSSQMFNYEKYEPMMENYELTGEKPFYTADYQDCVWVCDLRKLPKDLIYKDEKKGGWAVELPIAKQTMNPYAKKKKQHRFLIPNNYGQILYKCPPTKT